MTPRKTARPAYNKLDQEKDSFSDNESSSDESENNDNKINYKNMPSLRNAREIALMAEERWLIEMLKTIRQQRNALKVEALYYQGLKATLFARHAAEFGGDSVEPEQPDIFPADDMELDPIPEPTYPEMTQELVKCLTPTGSIKSQEELQKVQRINETEVPSNIDDFNILEGQCNEQELQNLCVVPEKKQENWDIEDPEYESEEEDALSRVNLDMSMLVGNYEVD